MMKTCFFAAVALIFCVVSCIADDNEFKNSVLYVARDVDSAEKKDVIVVEMVKNDQGQEVFRSALGVSSADYDKLKAALPQDIETKEVPIEQFPVDGLINVVLRAPDLYSRLLPEILKNASPAKVVDALPARAPFAALTPEAKQKISKENLAELTRLYSEKGIDKSPY